MPTDMAVLSARAILFDFALAENHMFARARVIFFQLKLFRLGAWVLFSDVKVASVGCAYEFNL